MPLSSSVTSNGASWTTADGHLFAEACPGAGKTRAIVARYLRRTDEEPRKGIALLSFTNAAIDEVRRRCGDRPDALTAPHFVGTFDGFINRFITRPLYVHHYGKTPRFIESWQDTKDGQLPPPSHGAACRLRTRLVRLRRQTARLPDGGLDTGQVRAKRSRLGHRHAAGCR